MAGFLLQLVVPKAINDAGPAAPGGLVGAVALNLLLIGLFGFFHSLLARDRVKATLRRVMPQAAERSTYVLQSSLCVGVAMAFWQPLGATIWCAEGLASAPFYALFGVGTGVVLWSTFLIDHFELFGLRQIWTHLHRRPMPDSVFATPALYRVVRHPMQLGIVVLLFATPHMTVGHLLFASAMTAYVFVGLFFEERALLRSFGERYAAYQRSTPMLIPGLRTRRYVASV